MSQNFFEANANKLKTEILEKHHELLSITPINQSGRDWFLIFNHYLQRYVKYAVILGTYETKEDLKKLYNDDRDTYEGYMFYAVNDSVNMLIPVADLFTMNIYAILVNTLFSTKIVLLCVLIASMLAGVIGYIIIIPRILTVMHDKSEVMKVFADISTKDIKEILADLASPLVSTTKSKKQTINTSLKKHKIVEEIQGNKPIETPLTQGIKTTHEAVRSVTEEEIEMRIKDKKRKMLKKTDKGTKWKSIFAVTGFFFIVLGYYGASIGINEFIFSNYEDLSINIRWVTLRQAASTFSTLRLRELFVTRNNSLEEIAAGDIDILYSYERNIQALTVRASSIYKNYINLINILDGTGFCDAIAPYLIITSLEQCKEEGYYSMARGMQNNIYQILTYLNSIHTQYDKVKDQGLPFNEILAKHNWDITCNLY